MIPTDDKSSIKKELFKELLLAKSCGYITNIQAVFFLEQNCPVYYHPNSISNDLEIPENTITSKNYSENNSEFDEIYIKFKKTVCQTTIEKVSKYISNTYNCNCSLHLERLDLHDFK